MSDKQKNGKGLLGRWIAFDPTAQYASPTEPAFIAPPKVLRYTTGSRFCATSSFRDSRSGKSPTLTVKSAMKAMLRYRAGQSQMRISPESVRQIILRGSLPSRAGALGSLFSTCHDKP
jgi:hypothetical protein